MNLMLESREGSKVEGYLTHLGDPTNPPKFFECT